MHADLSQLLDAVCRRANRVEICTTLEHSIRATVSTDRIGDSESVHTRYAEFPSEALQAALVDAAQWINAHPHHGERIATDWALPQVELAGALSTLLKAVVTTGWAGTHSEAVTNARAVLAKWGAS